LCCYLIGFGGGIVSGDHVHLDVCVQEDAALLITSQSTSKAFRSVVGRPVSTVQTTVTVHPGALLVWSPQPTQCFKQSNLSQNIHVTLEHSTATSTVEAPSLVLLDWYTGGRRNIDDGGWQLDCLKTITTVSYSSGVDGAKQELVFRDASMLSGCTSLQRHMGQFQVVAMMILVGARVQQVAQKLLSTFSSRNTYDNENCHDDIRTGVADGFLVSCGTVPTIKGQPEGVLVRIASQSLEKVARFLSIHIGALDGQLPYDPFSEIVLSRAGITKGQDWHLTPKPPSPVVVEVSGPARL
jgi:urease accessory protein